MFLITCPGCSTPHLASTTDVLSMHRTSQGLIGYVKCHDTGAIVVHNFTKAQTIAATGTTPTEPGNDQPIPAPLPEVAPAA